MFCLLKLLSVNDRTKVFLKEVSLLTMAPSGLIRTSAPAEMLLLYRMPLKPKVELLNPKGKQPANETKAQIFCSAHVLKCYVLVSVVRSL